MKMSRQLTLGIAAIGGMAALPLAAAAQTAPPAAPATPAPAAGATSFTDAQVQSFAKATVKAGEIQQSFAQPIAAAADAAAKAQVEANMNAQVVAAIEASGLDLTTYNAIATNSQTDTALRAKIADQIVAINPPSITVGGAEMLISRTALGNFSASSDHTKLTELVNAAGAQQAFSAPGEFTVFAPNNNAFGRLAPGSLDDLLKPENKASLTTLLTYHIVPQALSAAELTARIEAGGGTATLQTVAGQPLTITAEGAGFKLTDASGNASYVSQADIRDSNGVMHVINGVLLPKLG